MRSSLLMPFFVFYLEFYIATVNIYNLKCKMYKYWLNQWIKDRTLNHSPEHICSLIAISTALQNVLHHNRVCTDYVVVQTSEMGKNGFKRSQIWTSTIFKLYHQRAIRICLSEEYTTDTLRWAQFTSLSISALFWAILAFFKNTTSFFVVFIFATAPKKPELKCHTAVSVAYVLRHFPY